MLDGLGVAAQAPVGQSKVEVGAGETSLVDTGGRGHEAGHTDGQPLHGVPATQPLGDETNVTWYGTAVVDEDGVLGGAVDEVNALRMRTQEQFPNFGEVDDLANFEEIQRGLACQEDEWVYMHRGLGIPGRVKTDADGIITAPATDEAFMREYIKEWKRLMKARPTLAIEREP